MEKKDFETFEEVELQKGQFVKASWKSVKINKKTNDVYTKISNGVVRFVKYANINGVEVKGKVNPNEKRESEFLYYNENTKNYSVQLSTTMVKPTSTYYLNGVEITKQEYELANPPRKPRLDANGQVIQTPVFRVLLENLISLG